MTQIVQNHLHSESGLKWLEDLISVFWGPGHGSTLTPGPSSPGPTGSGAKKLSLGHGHTGAGAKKFSWGHGPTGAGAKKFSRGQKRMKMVVAPLSINPPMSDSKSARSW